MQLSMRYTCYKLNTYIDQEPTVNQQPKVPQSYMEQLLSMHSLLWQSMQLTQHSW